MLKPTPEKRKPVIRPYKVLTVFSHNGVAKKFIQRYIVIATSADQAVQSIKLRGNEEVIEAKELVDYELVIA